MNEIREINSERFEPEVLHSPIPVLVDFYAPWCGPCKALAPVLGQLAQEFDGRVRFTKVNVDESNGLAAQFNITGVPTLMLFSQGAPVAMMAGMVPAATLRNWIEKNLPLPVAGR
jgi:thioredoxin 1